LGENAKFLLEIGGLLIRPPNPAPNKRRKEKTDKRESFTSNTGQIKCLHKQKLKRDFSLSLSLSLSLSVALENTRGVLYVRQFRLMNFNIQ